jgi:hypothetical protein
MGGASVGASFQRGAARVEPLSSGTPTPRRSGCAWVARDATLCRSAHCRPPSIEYLGRGQPPRRSSTPMRHYIHSRLRRSQLLPTSGVLDRAFGLPEVPVVLDLEVESVRVSEEFKEPA